MHTTSLNVSHVHAICPSVCYNSVVRLFYSVIVLYGACPVLFTYRSMDTTTHRIAHFRDPLKCAIRYASRSIYITLNENHDAPYRAFQGPPEMRDTVSVPFHSLTAQWTPRRTVSRISGTPGNARYGACPVLFTYRSMDTTTHRIVHFRGSRKCAIRCASRSIYLTLNESHDEPYRAFQGPPEMRDTVRVPFCSSTTDDNHNAPHRAFPGVPEMCDTVRVLFYSTTAQ